MNDSQIKDKAVFVVGLLGAFLAFSSFKDDFAQIYISIGGNKLNLLGVIIIFVLLLATAVYLYALDYIKYSFGRFQDSFIFKWIIPVANFAYSAALLFPIFILCLWFISIPVINNFAKKFSKGVWSFDLVIGIISVLATLINTFFLTKRGKKDEVENIDKNKSKYLDRALVLSKKGFYGESILEAFKVLELTLRERLLEEKGVYTKYTNIHQLIIFAQKYKIIEDKYIPAIKDVVGLRNQVAHSSKSFSKYQAQFVLNTVRNILEHTNEENVPVTLYAMREGDNQNNKH